MNIKSTFLLTNIHTIIKILSGIIMNKVIAVYLGPSGLAMIGQFQNFVGIISGLANASIQTGIVKYTGEEKDNIEYLNKLMKNSLFISLLFSFIVSLFVFLFADYLSLKVMFSEGYANIFYFLSFSIVFYSLNLYVLSILNGLSEIKLFTIINIVISITTLFLSTFLTIFYKLNGALISIILVQSLVFCISYFLIYRKFGNDFFYFKNFTKNIDKKIIIKLFKFSIVSFSTGAIVSIMMITLRYIIEDLMSLSAAGIWEGAWRIMIYFNMLFILPFSIHYLPKFAAIKDKSIIIEHLISAFKFLIPISLLLAIFIYYFKNLIIKLLFSTEFIQIEEIIGYILLAEILRILAISLSNVFMSKAKVFVIIFMEFLFAFLMVLLSYFFIKSFGILGLGYAYLISSGIFLCIYVYKFKKWIIG